MASEAGLANLVDSGFNRPSPSHDFPAHLLTHPTCHGRQTVCVSAGPLAAPVAPAGNPLLPWRRMLMNHCPCITGVGLTTSQHIAVT